MRIWKGICIGLIGLLLVTSEALAGIAPRPAPGWLYTWQASYWNNVDLAGAPVFQGPEPGEGGGLNYNWGTGSPRPGINADYFSARWTNYLEVNSAATYRFVATSDDGVRVWLDGVLIINAWYDHPATTFTAERDLTVGLHYVVVEYYERTGDAMLQFHWESVMLNWRGEYFNNPRLEGNPTLVRDDAQINFDWGTGSPAPNINADGFSVRWTRVVNLPAGMYRFSMTVDDGGRLWVSDHLLIDAWREQPSTTYIADIYLPGGSTQIRMEYCDISGLAVAKLAWSSAGVTPTPVPRPSPVPGTVIVDDTDAGFVTGGTASSWRVARTGYNGRMLWTYNNDRVRPNYNWARWYPRLRAGWYEVFVYIPGQNATSTRARYWISHADGFTLRVVNQSAYSNQWVSLGVYRFRGTRDDYVSLADVTFESYLSRRVGFDAVKWVPRR